MHAATNMAMGRCKQRYHRALFLAWLLPAIGVINVMIVFLALWPADELAKLKKSPHCTIYCSVMTNNYASVWAAKWLVSGHRTAVHGTISLALACFLFNSGAAPSLIGTASSLFQRSASLKIEVGDGCHRSRNA